MIECLIIGDSIAVGTHRVKPECAYYAKGGWNTSQWNRDYLKNDLNAKTVIISLGSNDHKGIKTREELLKTRSKVNGTRVYWIIPAIKPPIQQIVRDIAKEYGDIVVEIKGLQPDKVHPSWNGYKQIAKETS